jgi:hypothetical protein
MRIPKLLNPLFLYNLQKPPQPAVHLLAWLSYMGKRSFDIFASMLALILLRPSLG